MRRPVDHLHATSIERANGGVIHNHPRGAGQIRVRFIREVGCHVRVGFKIVRKEGDGRSPPVPSGKAQQKEDPECAGSGFNESISEGLSDRMVSFIFFIKFYGLFGSTI